MKGNKVLIGVVKDGTFTALGHQRNATINRTRTAIDLSHKEADDEILDAGRRASTITLDSVYVPDDDAYKELKSAFENGGKVKVRVKEDTTETEEADCIITDLNTAFPDNEAATVSITLRVTGGWAPVVP